MADIPYYDLLNEVDCSDRCEAVIALCELVDKLIADIQFLELECISTHLTGRYSGESAYELYKNIMYSGGDPMEFRDYLVKVQEACKGNWPCWH